MTALAFGLHRRLPSVEQVLGRPGRVAMLVAAALVIAGSLSAPDNAHAIGIGLPGPPDLPGVPSLNPADWAVDALKAILKFIFGDQLKDLARHLVKLLLAVPLLTDTKKFPELNEYRDYVTGGAWGSWASASWSRRFATGCRATAAPAPTRR